MYLQQSLDTSEASLTRARSHQAKHAMLLPMSLQHDSRPILPAALLESITDWRACKSQGQELQSPEAPLNVLLQAA